MKTYLDCIPCFFKQALSAARIAGADEMTQKEVLNQLAALVPEIPMDNSPPEMGRIIYQMVAKITNQPDPFKKIKEDSNRLAQSLCPELEKQLEEAPDRLLLAIKLAATGNVIDYGAPGKFDLIHEVNQVLDREFAVFDYEQFKLALDKATTILYLADNAGEIVFDRMLIKELKKPVICAVRDKPVINDALMEDARYCGLDKIATVISSGCDAPGTILERCSPEFLAIYHQADLIISKGQGNFETLYGANEAIFFLFRVKCSVVVKDIGVGLGEMVLKKCP